MTTDTKPHPGDVFLGQALIQANTPIPETIPMHETPRGPDKPPIRRDMTTVTVVIEDGWPQDVYLDEAKARDFCKEQNEKNARELEARVTERKRFWFWQTMAVKP